MAYNNNYNNGYQGKYPQNSTPRQQSASGFGEKVNNNGHVLYNDKQGKFLEFDYWGKYVSLAVGSAIPGAPLNWETRKNSQRIKQVISFDYLNDLWDICEEVIDSIKATGTFTSAGVRVGAKGDAIVEINNGSSINMAPGIYLVIYKDIDSSNRSNSYDAYPFDDSKIVREYDHNTGTAKNDIGKVGQFKKFYRLVKEAAKAFTMAQAHAIQTLDHSDKLSCFKALAAIGSALGVDMIKELDTINKSVSSGKSSGSYNRKPYNNGGQNRGGYNGPRSGGWQNNRGYNKSSQPNGYQRQQQAIASMNDPIDINLSMDSLTNVDLNQFK